MFRFLWSIRPYFRQVAGELVLGSLAGILMNTAVVLPAIMLGRAIDVALAYARGAADGPSLAWASLAFVGATLATEVPRVFKRWYLITANGRMRANLRADLLRGVLAWPMQRVHRTPVGDLMARIVGDVEVWGRGVRLFTIETWDTVLFSISYVAALLWYDAGLTLVVLATTPLAMLVAYASGNWVRARTTAARQANAAYTTALQEQLTGVRVLRLFGRAQSAIAQVTTLSRAQADAEVASERLRLGLQPFYYLLMSAGSIVLVWQGSERVLAGLLSVGSFVAYVELYLRTINRGLRFLPDVINAVQASAAAHARLLPLLAPPVSVQGEPRFASFLPGHLAAAPGEQRDTVQSVSNTGAQQATSLLQRGADGKESSAGAQQATSLPQRGADGKESSAGAVCVSLQSVTFRYPGAVEAALKDITLDIPAGAFVAVTGPVGSGKSALARAVLGVYPLESGRILFGGADGADTSAAAPEPRMGYLPQEPYLFSGSIRENILFGAAGSPDLSAQVNTAALTSDIQSFPEGLDTQIGELGIRVSGGQRQRIALARSLAAFVPDEPGVLVLDDPFSAVDVNTEAQITGALRETFGPAASPERRATILLCSHRLAAFPLADLVVVLDGGRIRERGTHAALMQAGGLYARIYTAQQQIEPRP